MSGATGPEFVEGTKYKYLPPAGQQMGVWPPGLEAKLAIKGARVKLPSHKGISNAVRECIDGRRSVREYAAERLTAEELSYLLWCTQGVKSREGGLHTMRTVPSAGARHALETFVLANRVERLERHVYRFRALEHELEEYVVEEGVAERVMNACFGQEMVGEAAAVFVWAADSERMTWRYSQRGYRYIFLDAGHVCQNLYLAAEAIRCGCCAIAAFDDDAMNEILGLDGKKQFVIYLGAVGKKKGGF